MNNLRPRLFEMPSVSIIFLMETLKFNSHNGSESGSVHK